MQDIEKQIDQLHKRIQDSSSDSEKVELYRSLAFLLQEYDMPRCLEVTIAGRQLAKEIEDQKVYGLLTNVAGRVLRLMGRPSEAIEFFQESLQWFEQIDYGHGVALSLLNIGNVHFGLEQFDQAQSLYEQSRETAKARNQIGGVALSTGNIGNIHFSKGEYEEALDHYKSAVKIYREIEDEKGLALYLGNWGAALVKLGRVDEALIYLEESRLLHEKVGDQTGVLRIMINTASIKGQKGEVEESLKAYNECLELVEKLNLMDYAYQIYHGLSELMEKAQRFDEALEYFKKYREIEKDVMSEQAQFKATQLESRRQLEIKEKEVEIERLKNVELKQAYEDLEEAQSELIKKEQMATLGQIASKIAHEVQNPLNFVNNFSGVNAELLAEIKTELERFELNEDTKDLLKQVIENSTTIQSHGKRIANIVGELLTTPSSEILGDRESTDS